MADDPKDDEVVNGDMASSDEPIRVVAAQFRDALEAKDWEGLARILSFPSVWVQDRPLRTADFIERAREVLGEAEDVELLLVRVLRADVGESSGHASVTTRLLWSSAKTWEEHQLEFDLHFGFEKHDETWRLAFLGVSRSTGEAGAAVSSESGYFSEYFGAATLLSRYFQDFPMAAQGVADLGRYFEAAARKGVPYFEGFATEPYFATRAVPYFEERFRAVAPEEPPGPPEPPRMVLCYVPVLLPAEAARALLGKDK
ncbi:MAG TPA: hypothetical protein VF173_38235 [Thermoanaerobaculia bacterium]|nr:hypothetical protein [Thermoanaerobaculia bacterium]